MRNWEMLDNRGCFVLAPPSPPRLLRPLPSRRPQTRLQSPASANSAQAVAPPSWRREGPSASLPAGSATLLHRHYPRRALSTWPPSRSLKSAVGAAAVKFEVPESRRCSGRQPAPLSAPPWAAQIRVDADRRPISQRLMVLRLEVHRRDRRGRQEKSSNPTGPSPSTEVSACLPN
ncbi:uncharacterized protein A4U43_C03F12950 [Asparagus officinalis]|uniref:Uncharacterized protein n=1 Tax=Asparagus officinalis TaxID=4686 RepID=A0A5P1F9N2_ASPOF|nr:uncharacterized protein A4U43_C03F12950 [Asparagus officinalis]